VELRGNRAKVHLRVVIIRNKLNVYGKRSENRGYNDTRTVRVSITTRQVTQKSGERYLSKTGLDSARTLVLTYEGTPQVLRQRTYRVSRVSVGNSRILA
jgi:hypothetical protein